MIKQKDWYDNVSGALGIILFASPVNLLEECHGEGHAKNLKEKQTMKASVQEDGQNYTICVHGPTLVLKVILH